LPQIRRLICASAAKFAFERCFHASIRDTILKNPFCGAEISFVVIVQAAQALKLSLTDLFAALPGFLSRSLFLILC
jgi:hypothetical protein